MPQFQIPAFVHAQDYSGIGKSIDDLFSAYAQGKLQAQQLALGQTQLAAAQQQQQGAEASFRLANGGLSPQEVNQYLPQAMQPRGMVPSQPITPGLPQSQAQPPVLNSVMAQPDALTAPVPGVQQAPQPVSMQPAVEDPKLATVRAILAMHQQSNQLGAAQQVAGLQKTQAEAQKAGAEAGLTQAQVALLGGTGNVVDSFINQMKSGNATLDDLSNFGRGDVANAIREGVMAKASSMGLDTNALANQQTKNKATATLQGDRGQVIGASAGTLEDLLNQAAPLVKQLNPSQLQAVNDAYSKGLKSVKNDPTATKFLTYMSEARGKYAQVLALGNAPSEQDKEAAAESIGRGLGPDAYDAMHEAVSFAANSTHKRFMGQGFNEEAPKGSPDIVKAGGKASAPPPVTPAAAAIIKAGLAKGLDRAAIKAQLQAAGH
jgi:hypothetical protein